MRALWIVFWLTAAPVMVGICARIAFDTFLGDWRWPATVVVGGVLLLALGRGRR